MTHSLPLARAAALTSLLVYTSANAQESGPSASETIEEVVISGQRLA